MEMKKLLKVVFFLVTYLTCSLAMPTYHGCGPSGNVAEKTMRTNVIGEASGDEFGNYKEKKVDFHIKDHKGQIRRPMMEKVLSLWKANGR
ncbi:unnamed protein product [Eruca vesicaria subsp. sativa]|uniref:Uncharacterized protein n=1 Tax=Eruca vesicaria subsp. sativa TaxID=29727 RepID=A0ABC8KDL8_ERUVS|nr:unnamed protein product [Eruca vesicaria subsp. sativa]